MCVMYITHVSSEFRGAGLAAIVRRCLTTNVGWCVRDYVVTVITPVACDLPVFTWWLGPASEGHLQTCHGFYKLDSGDLFPCYELFCDSCIELVGCLRLPGVYQALPVEL